jgi:hypothetical protein
VQNSRHRRNDRQLLTDNRPLTFRHLATGYSLLSAASSSQYLPFVADSSSYALPVEVFQQRNRILAG